MSKQYEDVGIVRELTRFPVKSMAGESVTETRLGWHGFDGDRRFAFLQSDDRSGFPWLTAREYPALVLYRAYFAEPSNVRESAVRVRTPGGYDWPIQSDDLLDDIRGECGKAIQLIQLWSGAFDAMDVSLISAESINAVATNVGADLDHRRFRSNILLEAASHLGKSFPEDTFVGKLLKFGDGDDSATIRIKRKDARCMVVNIDPDTGAQTPAVLKQIIAQRKNNLGVYGTTERPGTLKVGDIIRVARE